MDPKPISKTAYKKLAYRWTGEKAINLFQQSNIGGDIIAAKEEVEITGRDSQKEGLNIKSKNGVEIYGIHYSHLSHKK